MARQRRDQGIGVANVNASTNTVGMNPWRRLLTVVVLRVVVDPSFDGFVTAISISRFGS
jgi:hypothetical protein